MFSNIDRRRKDRFSYFDDRDASDGSGEFLLPSVFIATLRAMVWGPSWRVRLALLVLCPVAEQHYAASTLCRGGR